MRSWLSLAALGVIGLVSAPALRAQTVVGTWQVSVANQRGVIKITGAPDGALHGEAYYLGQEMCCNTRNGNPISTIEVKGHHVHLEFDEERASFDGNLSDDGDTLSGVSVNGSRSTPLTFRRATEKTAWPIDPSPHKVLFVPVEKGVRLEVLDWGGNGPPLIFLPGNGGTAHVFDDFATLFTGKHHVYGITRRGFGLSGRPAPTAENYDADRLGDDVLAVIDALKLDRPVIAGHSWGGEELSSIGTRHPEKVSGLIYLDASYSYAFYTTKVSTGFNRQVDIATVARDVKQITEAQPSQAKAMLQEMEDAIPRVEEGLKSLVRFREGSPDEPAPPPPKLRDQIEQSLDMGMRKYTAVKGPVLAIVASPHTWDTTCGDPQNKVRDADVAAQADAFEAGTPSARVVRIRCANHFVFLSNQAEVVREMNAFMDGLH